MCVSIRAVFISCTSMLLASSSALAFTATLTGGGTPVHWNGGFKFNLAGNWKNASGLSESDVYHAVTRSLQRWKAASGGAVDFDYWQGNDASVYEPNSNYNGLSSVYFASNANGSTGLSANILGLTQVWYNTTTGQILEADTVLNDRNFVFTTNPSDTSGFGSSNSSYAGKNHVFVENVLTHEFGHAFGLSHSGQLQSTMLFMESPEQAHLGCDEQVAIHNLYPTSDAGSRSTIMGEVVGPNGTPLLGVNVDAVSRRRGTVLASGMTDRSGHYSISGLEPGDYFLMAEPYFAGSAPLPSYYGGMSPQICPGDTAFGRTLLVDGTGFRAQAVSAPAGGTVAAPNLIVGCDHGGAAVVAAPSALSSSGAPLVFDGLRDGSGFGTTDRFTGMSTHTFHLSNVSGHLEIRALSYSLYSPIALTIDLLDSSGTAVTTAQTLMPVYSGDSGYSNFDIAVTADDLPMGDYYLSVAPSPMNATLYPAGPVSLDSVPFALITGTVNEGNPGLTGTIPFNARCRMAENFAAYQSPPGQPPRSATENEDTTSGGCGVIDTSGKSSGGRGGPTGPSAVGWFIPWILMGLIARLARRAARR